MLLTGLMVGAMVGAFLTFAWRLFRQPMTKEEEAAICLRQASKAYRRLAGQGQFQQELFIRLLERELNRGKAEHQQ